MCIICDGMSWEEVEQREEMIFAVYGWMLSSVEPGPHGFGWHYTVGLHENFGVPDLLVTSEADFERGGLAVRDAARLVVEDGLDLETAVLRQGFDLASVEMSDLREDTLVSWVERYGRWPEPGEMMLMRSLRVSP